MEQSITSKQIIELIKGLLKKHRYSYADLGKTLGLTEASIKRLMSQGDISIERLELIAEWFGFDFFDFLAKARPAEPKSSYFSARQENVLLKTPIGLYVMIQLSVGFPLKKIRENLKMSSAEFIKVLYVLDKVDLIELRSESNVKIRMRAPFKMLEDGALKGKLQPLFLAEVLRLARDAKNSDSQILVSEFYMSKKLLKKMREDLASVHQKYMELARLDQEVVSTGELQPVSEIIFNTVHNSWGKVLGSLPTEPDPK